MNVLAKIVIPRLLQSIAYIISEIEEKAREEFFRMKKIVQVKKKNRIKPETGKLKHICEGCILCGAPKKDVSFIPEAPEAIEDPLIELLSNFKKQTADIIAATNDLEKPNLLDETDSFVKHAKVLQNQLDARNKYAENLRVKLQNIKKKRASDHVTECPDFVPAGIAYEDLCTKCQLTYLNQYGLPADQQERKSSFISPPCSPPASPLQQVLQSQIDARNKSAENLHVKLQNIKKERDLDHVTECPDFVPAGIEYEGLCSKCQLTYINQYGLPADEQERKSSLISPPCSPPASPLQQGDEPRDEEVEGIFETEIEVITKIVRKIHPDGSVTEDKKVIKIRRETKKPLQPSQNPDQMGREGRLAYRSSNASCGSGLYYDRKQVGYVEPDAMTPFRKLYSYSEIVTCNSSMCYPVARYCVSIPNIICSSEFDINKDVVDEFKTLSEKFDNILDQYKKSKSDNITSTTKINSLLNKSDTKLLALLSEDNNFNFSSTSHFSLYKDLVMPDLKYKSCINLSSCRLSSKNEKA